MSNVGIFSEMIELLYLVNLHNFNLIIDGANTCLNIINFVHIPLYLSCNFPGLCSLVAFH